MLRLSENKLKPVAEGKKIKSSNAKSVRSMILSEETDGIGSYILNDILIPAVKELIADVIINSTNMTLFGNSRGTRRGITDNVSFRNNYNRISTSKVSNSRSYERQLPARSERYSTYQYDQVGFGSKREAEEVIDCLNEIIDTYNHASVMDFYELAKVTGEFTDNDYGWTSPIPNRTRYTSSGWIIDFPKIEHIA